MEEVEYIIHYIRRNERKQTIKEMAISLDITDNRLRSICTANNLKPITERERRSAFILEHYYKLSQREMAKRLGLSENAVRTIIKEDNIKERAIPEEQTKNINPPKETAEKKEYKIIEKTLNDKLIEAAKEVLKHPEYYHEMQIILAESVRQDNLDKFE